MVIGGTAVVLAEAIIPGDVALLTCRGSLALQARQGPARNPEKEVLPVDWSIAPADRLI